MRLKGISLVLAVSIVCIGCSSSKKVLVTDHPALDTMMARKEFEFKATSARPMVTTAMSQVAQSGLIPPGSNISRIDLSGGGNFLKIEGDSVTANLAYYGERRLGGGGYNNNSGITFKGVPDAIEIIKDDSKSSYSVKFSIREKMEIFQIHARISPNLSGTVDIISSHRTNIAYTGTASEIQEKK